MQIIVCKLVVLLFCQNNKAPKPKQCLSATGTNKMLQHAGRIMKLTAVLLLGVCMQIYAAGYGQRITLSERDVPIEKVLKKIQQQTTFKFLYTSQLLQRVPKVTVVVRDATVQDVLDLVLKGQMLDYEVSESTVVIRAKKEMSVKETTQADMPDPIEIRGVITDENGAPASGVNIAVKGTNKGTTTNLRGEFVLRDISENAVLLITSVGYDRQEILVKGKDVINTQLRVAVGNLDEMQVIAYGKTSKRLSTGNVSTVKARDIELQPINNPLLALQGRVPGLFIEQSNGLPGTGVKVRVQGTNSMSKGNDPLYVVDGMPYTAQLLPNIGSILGSSGGAIIGGISPGSGNPLSYLNPADIESIDVLKDADATAIYGSRAANGAILITTKQGVAGQTKLNVNMQTGWGKIASKLDLLNRQQYLKMRNEAFVNDGLIPSGNPSATTPYRYAPDVMLWDTTSYTDWQKELIGGTAKFNDVQATVSGGSSTTHFLFGGGYHKETTVFPGELSDRKGSLHITISNVSSNQKFRFQFSGNYMVDDNRLQGTDLTGFAIRLAPNAPRIFNSDGSLNWETNAAGNSTWTNPLSFTLQKYKNKNNNLIGSAFVNYQLMKGLEVKTNLGYTDLRTNEVYTSPLAAFPPEYSPFGDILRTANYQSSSIYSWVIEPQANYKGQLGKGSFDVQLGTTFLQSKSRGIGFNTSGFSSDLVLEDINSAAIVTPNFTNPILEYKYNAFFGRFNYVWNNKYIINLTARRDGSSRFGPQNRLHDFASIAGAWIFSKESFIEKNLSFLSFGKLRSSYGTTGNDQIGDYQYLNLYNAPSGGGIPVSAPYQGAIGLQPENIPNPYLEWEETKKINLGLDLGFFNDRILLLINYFKNRSSNQLLSYSLPITTGFPSIATFNFPATVENSGWEFSLKTSNIINKDFTWISNINLTIPKNKLIDFPNLNTSTYANTYIIGEPITLLRVYHFLGVDPITGTYQFSDKEGNPTSTPNSLTDRITAVNTSPTLYGGFQNNVTFKGFSMDFLFQFVKQKGLNYSLGDRPGIRGVNQPKYILDRWQKSGDISEIQRYSAAYPLSVTLPYYYASGSSDAGFSDASYIRLKNISISWQLPKQLIKIPQLQLARIYIQGQNLLTVTNYKGLDPETKNVGSLPPLRVITMGVQVNL